MQKPGKSCRQIATVITNYLRAHPHAADSDEGIADWWVAGSGLQASLEDVREALALLEAEKVVESQPLADGRLIYRAAARLDRLPH